MAEERAAGKQVRFVFSDGRSALTRAESVQDAIQLISDARQRGIWPTLYGIAMFYYQPFYVELKEWSPEEQQAIAAGLNILKVP